MRRIGIFSGSFDPVHEGHIAFAIEAMQQCGLDTVVFMPERFPRGKPNVSPLSERITHLKKSLSQTSFKVLDTQTDQFTVNETLAEIEALYSGAELVFLIGSDVALTMPDWHHVRRLTTRYNLAIGMRFGNSADMVRRAMKRVGARFDLIDTPFQHMSSTLLR